MSSTRTNTTGDLKPERWASSPEFDRAIKANLVAARAALLDGQYLEVVWFLQYLSMRKGGLRWAASEVAPDFIEEGCREKWLAQLCLDPGAEKDLARVFPRLRQLLADFARTHGEGGAVTEIGRMVNAGLEYCSQARAVVMISGRPRIGKTFAARKWVEGHPGRARYCQVPSSADDLAFFSAIAAALGITIESNAQTKNLRPRIEAALAGGDLMLVLDEAANLFPSHNYRLARPPRISWLMTALINQGASVALLVTPQFFEVQADYVHKSGWAAAQFQGRIARFIALPDRASGEDLLAVARAWLPDGDKRSLQALADVAQISQKHLAAIQDMVELANFYAKENGRENAAWEDIRRAIRTNVLPSDTALLDAVKNAAAIQSADGSRA